MTEHSGCPLVGTVQGMRGGLWFRPVRSPVEALDRTFGFGHSPGGAEFAWGFALTKTLPTYWVFEEVCNGHRGRPKGARELLKG